MDDRREFERRYHREYEIFSVELDNGERRIQGVLADIHDRGMSFFLPLREQPPADIPLSQYLGLGGDSGRVRVSGQVLPRPLEIDTRIVYQARSAVLTERFLVGLEFRENIQLPDAVLAIALQE